MEFAGELAVYTAGSKENPAIIFIHGFPFSAAMWEKQVEALKNDHFCISYDNRGFGKSVIKYFQFAMEDLADDVITVLDHFSVQQSVICGLSMGGYIALRALEKYRNRFRAAVLCDTKSSADNNAQKLKRVDAIASIRTIGAEKFVRVFVPSCIYEPSIKKLGAFYTDRLDAWSAGPSETLIACQLAMSGRTDTTEFLKTVSIPALVICGEYDQITPPDVMKAMSDNISNAQFHLIRNSGHLAPMEDAETVNALIRNFLKNL